ncbi:hypothetical protein J2S09_000191 [Bacillus fengqiuensis]|nr:hypothetical protein [Bacillus fengqiuensis]
MNRKFAWGTVAILICLLLASCSSKIENPLNWEVKSFTYEDSNGKVMKSYSAVQDVPCEEIIKDIQSLH